jgi:hypothetical protein
VVAPEGALPKAPPLTIVRRGILGAFVILERFLTLPKVPKAPKAPFSRERASSGHLGPPSCPRCEGQALDRTPDGDPYCSKCSRVVEVAA